MNGSVVSVRGWPGQCPRSAWGFLPSPTGAQGSSPGLRGGSVNADCGEGVSNAGSRGSSQEAWLPLTSLQPAMGVPGLAVAEG